MISLSNVYSWYGNLQSLQDTDGAAGGCHQVLGQQLQLAHPELTLSSSLALEPLQSRVFLASAFQATYVNVLAGHLDSKEKLKTEGRETKGFKISMNSCEAESMCLRQDDSRQSRKP